MSTSNFDRLLERYLKGEVSPLEKAKIDTWLDSNKVKNGKEFIWSKHDEEVLFQKITDRSVTANEVAAYRPAKGAGRSLGSQRRLQVAASLILLIAASVVAWNLVRDDDVRSYATGSQQEKNILADGTLVWMQPNSELTYDEADEYRHASLQGEALFEVAKDASRPFTIACGDITATVVGTSFNLKTSGNSIELKVLTGKVHVASIRDKEGVDVLPNEKIVFGDGSHNPKENLLPSEVAAVAVNTEYNMQFRDMTIEEAVKKLEKKFNVEINIETPSINTCRITADFTDHSLEGTLAMMAEVLDFTYRIDGANVVLSGNGCH